MSKRLLWLLFAGALAYSVISAISGCGSGRDRESAVRINGAGATFPYPVYSKWADKHKAITGAEINYQPIGSGGGVQQIKAKTVDFGASDAPLTQEELDKDGLMQFPMVMGGVVPVVNVSGVKPGELKLSSDTLSRIFLGKITKWNDRAIAADNPGLSLPSKDITVVTRSDGSGTTWIFTNYLDKVSPEWRKQVGFGKAVDWPAGVSFKGNDGVAAQVKILDGSIGYVEYAFALENNMSHTQLRNRAGKFVQPSISSFQAAAANADWAKAPGLAVILTDQPGEESWPASGATYIIIYKDQQNEKIGGAVLEFFDWCYEHGGDIAKKLHYVPMPESVVSLVHDRWKSEVKANGEALWR